MDGPKDPDSVAAGGVVSREELYILVWAEPMLKVAKQFGVSSSYMARVCTVINVPRPERGYWAKRAFGKIMPQQPLPDARPDDQLTWGRGVELQVEPRPLPKPPTVLPRRAPKLPKNRNGLHPLVDRAKPLFEAGRLAYRSNYLKPYKQLLVDLAVSKTGLDRALSFADVFFWQLEDRGHRVVIAPEHEHFWRADADQHEVPVKKNDWDRSELWSPRRPTVVYLGTLAIGLTIIELSERADAKSTNDGYVRLEPAEAKRLKARDFDSWRYTTHDFPSNRLCLQAYCPYRTANWSKQWREAKGEDLKKRIPSIIRELVAATPEIVKLIEEGERQAAIERQRWEEDCKRREHEEAEKRAADALEKSKQQLLEFINSWAEARRINAFIDDVAAALSAADPNTRQKLEGRLDRARSVIGEVNPLLHLQEWQSPEDLLACTSDRWRYD